MSKLGSIVFEVHSQGFLISNEEQQDITQVTKSIWELKRLQKEIDEAKSERDEIVQLGLDTPTWNDSHRKKGEIIETNQQKIKEIIESL